MLLRAVGRAAQWPELIGRGKLILRAWQDHLHVLHISSAPDHIPTAFCQTWEGVWVELHSTPGQEPRGRQSTSPLGVLVSWGVTPLSPTQGAMCSTWRDAREGLCPGFAGVSEYCPPCLLHAHLPASCWPSAAAQVGTEEWIVLTWKWKWVIEGNSESSSPAPVGPVPPHW